MLGILSLALLGAAAAPQTCESLASVRLQQATITSAAVIPAGPFVQPGGGRGRQGAAPEAVEALPEHCRVKMVLKPTPDSNINAELWMPTVNWNGTFMAVGNGGFAGSIQGYGEMQTALRLGYATAGNDTGHSDADGPGGMFALGHPEKIVDFAYRAVHEMTANRRADRRVLRQGAAVLVFQGLLDRRTTGRDGGTALSRRLRRHHRRRARQPAHPDAHGRRRAHIELGRHPEPPSRRPRRSWSTTW